VIGRNRVNLIVGWSGRFLFFDVPRQFSQDTREWPENQILIPDWTYFHCPGATLLVEWPENQILIPDWTYFHCPGATLGKDTFFSMSVATLKNTPPSRCAYIVGKF